MASTCGPQEIDREREREALFLRPEGRKQLELEVLPAGHLQPPRQARQRAPRSEYGLRSISLKRKDESL